MQESEFIEEYRGLVTSLVNRIRARYDLNTDLEELESFGFTGLLEAKARFDPSRGVKFNTFAYYRVRGAILDGVRKMAFMPPRAHAALKVAESAGALLEGDGAGSAARRDASSPSVGAAKTKEASVKAIDDALAQLTASFVIASLGQSQENDAPQTPEDRLVVAEEAVALERLIGELPDREQALIRGHYFDGRRFDEVAAELGISKSWASRLHTKALAAMRERLEPGRL